MTVNINNTALIVVDIQGKLARTVDNVNEVYQNWLKVIRAARLFQMPILVLEQYPQGLGHTIEDLQVELGDSPVFAKRTFSAYREESFVKALEALEIENLLIIGVEAHVCVFQTTLDLLNETNYEIYLLADGVSSRKATDRDYAIDRLKTAGATISTTEMTLFELMADSSQPLFRDFLKIVK